RRRNCRNQVARARFVRSRHPLSDRRAWPSPLASYAHGFTHTGGYFHAHPRTRRSKISNLEFEVILNKLAQLDHAHIWHPFTQMRYWLAREPIVIVEGEGSVLRDAHGRE